MLLKVEQEITTFARVRARGLCRMKMLPVIILAKYYSSTWSAVSERPNLNARLVSQMSQPEPRNSFLSVQYYYLGKLTVQLILNIPLLLLNCYVFSDSEIFIRHLNHTIQQHAIKSNTNRKKHVGRLPLRHCYVASMGSTKLDT